MFSSVVVARTADIGVEDGQALIFPFAGPTDGLTVEPVVEDRLDRAVVARADLQGYVAELLARNRAYSTSDGVYYDVARQAAEDTRLRSPTSRFEAVC